MNVLFVCSGNICRSPMAEAYCRHRAAQLGLGNVSVRSAGTLGIDGAPASPEAIKTMGEIGIDLAAHRSQGLMPEHLHGADLVVAMTVGHLREMALWPALMERRELIRAYENGPVRVPNPPDLADPIGHDIEFYREVRDIIKRCVDHFLEQDGVGPGGG